MAFLSEPNCQPPYRPCPRWGELDDIKHGRNYRVTDGFSRFRTSFDACHEMPLVNEVAKLEGFAYPRPFEVEIGKKIKVLPISTRHVERGHPIDVFPQNNPARLNDQGQYCLSEPTRESLHSTINKLYVNSRYQLMFPGKYKSADLEQNLPLKTCTCSKHVHFLCSEQINDRCALTDNQRSGGGTLNDVCSPLCIQNTAPMKSASFHNGDTNQNFNLLMSSIYNYKLPSALHMPDDHWQEDYLPFLHQKAMKMKPAEEKKSKTFDRPLAPGNIEAFMNSVMTEINISESDKTQQQTVNDIVVRATPEPCVGEWENSSVLYKLKLDDKAGTQRRYHQSHEDPLPDLRDNGKYEKRVFFYGYNSSAFRG